jgi:hypothetical protein
MILYFKVTFTKLVMPFLAWLFPLQQSLCDVHFTLFQQKMASSNYRSLLNFPSAPERPAQCTCVRCISPSPTSPAVPKTLTPVTVSEPNTGCNGRWLTKRKKVAYCKRRCICSWCSTPSPTSLPLPQTLTASVIEIIISLMTILILEK